MTEPVFTREIYPLNQFLNPSRSKLNHFLKKSKVVKDSQRHTRVLSLDRANHHHCCCCGSDGQCGQQLKQMLFGNAVLLKQIKQVLTCQKSRAVVTTLAPYDLQHIKQKTSILEHELKQRDQRIDSIKEKYDELITKFQNFTTHSKHNSSFDTNTNRSFSPSRKGDILKQLRRLKERLKNIDFSEILRMLNQIEHQHKY